MPSPGSLMLDLQGLVLTDEEAELLCAPEVGGVILFSRNFQSVGQLAALTRQIRERRSDIILAVDHEGGRVQRFREGFTRLPPMAALGRCFDVDPTEALRLAAECGWLLAAELRAFDIDISFAPILDLDYGQSSVIGDRSFHADPRVVSQLATSLMAGMHSAGMAATGKHFPGHGYAEADSHVAVPIDDRRLGDIRRQDIQPFQTLISAGLDAVMPAHVIYPEIDSRPAGFSRLWLQTILREELGFDGVIFSDDLSMAGAGVVGGYEARAEAALSAGCDMILVCNAPAGAREVLRWLHASTQRPSARLSALRAEPAQAGSLAELQDSDRWRCAREAVERIRTLAEASSAVHGSNDIV